MRELRVSLAQPVIVFVNQMTSCCFDFFLPFEEKRERKVKDRRLWPLRAKELFFQNLNFVVEILQNTNVSRMKYENPTVSSGIPTRTLGACRIDSSSYERTTSKRGASSEFSWFILFYVIIIIILYHIHNPRMSSECDKEFLRVVPLCKNRVLQLDVQ